MCDDHNHDNDNYDSIVSCTLYHCTLNLFSAYHYAFTTYSINTRGNAKVMPKWFYSHSGLLFQFQFSLFWFLYLVVIYDD